MTASALLSDVSSERLISAVEGNYERIGFQLTEGRINRYLWRNE